MNLGPIDLHAHSTCSDGLLDPAALVTAAAEAGADVFALTDHDTMRGCATARATADALGVQFLSGMEISTRHDATDVHLLAFFASQPDLSAFEALRAEARHERFWAIAARLAELGFPLDEDDLRQSIQGASPGRPHLARALVAAGHVADEHEAFNKWLGRGRPGHLAQRVPTTLEAIGNVRAWGGVTSIAHPGLDKLESLIPTFAEGGLDAVEAYHGGHTPQETKVFVNQSAELGLLVTGGSDFHGPSTGRQPGRSALPLEAWTAFSERLQARGTQHAD